MTNSRRKGARGELEAAKELARVLGIEARRGKQYSGIEGKDIVTSLDGRVHFESKRRETLSLYPALEQAARDAAEGEIPVVLHRRNQKPWVVIVELRHLLALAAAIEAKGGE